ncbi:MAG: type III-B CRISPR module RAMP protein Cmr6 [Caldilineaceae bacterium]|nr:type III-B CRISPR module RAMP protein Cmr6 [Caldilineaceae bacterium]
MTNYHPRDTAQLVQSNQIDNFALRYRHFLRIAPGAPDFKYKIESQPSTNALGESSQDLVKQLRQRQTQQLLHFVRCGIQLYCVDATVDWRLIVGLGSDHVQETNMTLHHIYGIPYIPGTAVKGVLRHWWMQEDFDNDENKALCDEEFVALFGDQNQRGKVQFLDAYPGEIRFAQDIMNPHYPGYYSGSKPPTDDQNPVPISFLTVERTGFRFVFLTQISGLLDRIKERFEKALEMKGIGAKTAVGYGYFRDFKNQTDDIIDVIKRQQQAKQEETERKREAECRAALSPVERLAEELNCLTASQEDEARATHIYTVELQSLQGDDQRMIAQALKEYWQRINKWSGGSKKQRAKVQTVKSILGES